MAVVPSNPPTAMDPAASNTLLPKCCVAMSAAPAMPHPATAAASSATTATEVGSCPLCDQNTRVNLITHMKIKIK